VESRPFKKIDDNLAAPLAYALVLTAMLFLGR
jgi:multisubunit Na+/H+ antiporter MnhC subunit